MMISWLYFPTSSLFLPVTKQQYQQQNNSLKLERGEKTQHSVDYFFGFCFPTPYPVAQFVVVMIFPIDWSI